MKRRRAKHEPSAGREGLLRVIVASLSEEHPRTGLHAEVRPEPSGLAPLCLHRARMEAGWVRIRRAISQLLPASFVEPEAQYQSIDGYCASSVGRRKPLRDEVMAVAAHLA